MVYPVGNMMVCPVGDMMMYAMVGMMCAVMHRAKTNGLMDRYEEQQCRQRANGDKVRHVCSVKDESGQHLRKESKSLVSCPGLSDVVPTVNSRCLEQ